MSHPRLPSVLCICALVIACLSARAAEPPFAGGNQRSARANEVTQFKGKLKDFSHGVLTVTREDGTDVMVKPPEDIGSFTFVAPAKPMLLHRGSMVRFSGSFNPNGVATSPIEKVEIFQPVQTKELRGHTREKFIAGVYAADRRGPKNPQTVAKYNVVGGLMGISPTGVMLVQAGKHSVKAPLGKNATFEVRYNNLSLAQAGDPVSVAGFYEPPDDTKVHADRITITTDRVYGEPPAEEPRKKGRGRAKPDAEAEKPAEDAGADKPETVE